MLRIIDETTTHMNQEKEKMYYVYSRMERKYKRFFFAIQFFTQQKSCYLTSSRQSWKCFNLHFRLADPVWHWILQNFHCYFFKHFIINIGGVFSIFNFNSTKKLSFGIIKIKLKYFCSFFLLRIRSNLKF